MIVQTGRFGAIEVTEDEIIHLSQGLLGFPEYTKFCLVDPGDDVLILWLQSVQSPEIAFPILEPKIFKLDYTVRLSAQELRELRLENINHSAVFSILTISDDVSLMTANLKAPIVVNLREKIAKQVVLQENEFSIKHPMFKELRMHLVTLQSQRTNAVANAATRDVKAVDISTIPPSLTVKSLVPASH